MDGIARLAHVEAGGHWSSLFPIPRFAEIASSFRTNPAAQAKHVAAVNRIEPASMLPPAIRDTAAANMSVAAKPESFGLSQAISTKAQRALSEEREALAQARQRIPKRDVAYRRHDGYDFAPFGESVGGKDSHALSSVIGTLKFTVIRLGTIGPILRIRIVGEIVMRKLIKKTR